MTIGEKIKGLRKQKGLNQTELAELLGVTQAHVSALERNDRRLTNDIKEKIQESFPDVDTEWITTEKEWPLKPHSATLVDIEAVALVPAYMQHDLFKRMKDPDFRLHLSQIVVDIPHNAEYLAFEVNGDQMLYDGKLAIYPGDVVIGRKIDPSIIFESDRVYAIISNGKGVVINNFIKDGPKLIAAPLNMSYTTFEIPLDEVDICYRIILLQSKRHSL